MAKNTHDHKDCQDYLKLLSDYIDGDLDRELCAKIEAHLAGCSNCTVVVDTIKRTIELYQIEEGDQKLPQNVKKRLFSRLSLDEFLK